jgi:hypothetical protein
LSICCQNFETGYAVGQHSTKINNWVYIVADWNGMT